MTTTTPIQQALDALKSVKKFIADIVSNEDSSADAVIIQIDNAIADLSQVAGEPVEPVATSKFPAHEIVFNEKTIKRMRDNNANAERGVLEGWTQWDGGECPIPEGSSFDLQFRDGSNERSSCVNDWHWKHQGSGGDIIAYRLNASPQPADQQEKVL